MGNENHQITFPIQNNNNDNKVRISNKKIKAKDNVIKQTESKNKNPKILKGYVIPRISATPDRNISITGINKDKISNKRYGSYEKNLKTNSNNIKNKDNNIKKLINDRNISDNKGILYITNLLNTIYSNEIYKELSHINIGTKNLNFNNTIKNKKFLKKDEINFMFDATFKYNYFYKNYNKINRKRNNSKNRYNSPHLYDSKFQSNEFNEMKNSKKDSINPNIINIKVNENINKNDINPNTTLILNQSNIDAEIISVNNKIKITNNINNYNNANSNKINHKKYSESKFIYDSESGFISSEEISLLNNIKIDKKSKEEDASESQTDKQEIINQNLTNKNKINNNYFIDSISNKKYNNNNIIFKKNELNIISNINNFQYNSNSLFNNETKNDNSPKNTIRNNNNKNKGFLNNKDKAICNQNNKIYNQKNNDDEIILMGNESNKYDDNSTYMEILLAMNEKKPEEKNIVNTIKTRTKKIKKDKDATKQKTYDNEKKLFIPGIIKREITPKNMGNKTPKISNANKMILKNKKIAPIKKIPINGNINNNNINNCLSSKKPERKSINKSNKNSNNGENNISPKKFIRKSINKSNNNSPIINNGNSYLNFKNKKNAKTPPPLNSQIPSPLNHYNNNYKDRYTYKKKSQINNSLRKNKKISDNTTNTNNSSYRNSINNNNFTNGNNTVNKNSNLCYKINNNCVCFNNSRKAIRSSGNRNKIIYFKKERLSGNSLNKPKNFNEIQEVEPRTKSNDQKYSVYNSKTVLSSTKKGKNN